jgi:hypothetical protein
VIFSLLFCIVFSLGFFVGVYQRHPFTILTAEKVAVETKHEAYQPFYKSSGASFNLPTYRHSYFSLDASGSLVLENSLPHRAEGRYRFVRTIRAVAQITVARAY